MWLWFRVNNKKVVIGGQTMDVIKSYKDLCEEIEIWKERIKAYKVEIEALKKLAKFEGPSDISAIDYTRPSVSTSGQLGFEDALIRIQKIESHIELHKDTIERLERSKENLEERIEQLEGLDKRVIYKRDVEEKKLYEIADELGFSEIYIKKISARNPRE